MYVSSPARRGCARGLHQRTKERPRKRVIGHSFRMPLHAENPVLVRLVLNSLDHPIGCNRGNAQAVPKVSNRLVMRGVYPHVESSATLLNAAAGRQLSEFAARVNQRGMDRVRRVRRKAFLAMLDVRV